MLGLQMWDHVPVGLWLLVPGAEMVGHSILPNLMGLMHGTLGGGRGRHPHRGCLELG